MALWVFLWNSEVLAWAGAAIDGMVEVHQGVCVCVCGSTHIQNSCLMHMYIPCVLYVCCTCVVVFCVLQRNHCQSLLILAGAAGILLPGKTNTFEPCVMGWCMWMRVWLGESVWGWEGVTVCTWTSNWADCQQHSWAFLNDATDHHARHCIMYRYEVVGAGGNAERELKSILGCLLLSLSGVAPFSLHFHKSTPMVVTRHTTDLCTSLHAYCCVGLPFIAWLWCLVCVCVCVYLHVPKAS